MPTVILLALLIVAMILSAIELIDAHGRSLVAWAALLISVVLVVERL